MIAQLIAVGLIVGPQAVHDDPPLAWVRTMIDGQPALSIQTDAHLAVLLQSFPHTPIAEATITSHSYFWEVPGLTCGDRPDGTISRSPEFVFVDGETEHLDNAQVRANRRRHLAIAVHNRELLERGEIPPSLNCRHGNLPPADWANP